ncbi:MAG: hypothetical protein ACREX8_17820, partial [Gammaproteobacteria bacterium]
MTKNHYSPSEFSSWISVPARATLRSWTTHAQENDAMDDSRFDTLARSLSEARPRRGVVRVLGGLALAGLSSLLGLTGTDAKKKGNKNKKKKKKGPCGNGCSGGTLCCGDRCVSVLTDRNNCGACGKQCGVTELCLNAQCAPCEDPMALCTVAGEQKCVDVRTDRNNCGFCGTICAKDPEIASRDEVCVDRQCDCPPG